MIPSELETYEKDYNWDYNQRRMIKHMCENDGMQFLRYFFKLREGNKLVRNWHHYVIEHVLQKVYDCKIQRLIINIPPGYTKTEQAVINFIGRGLAINPRSKYIHTSYSASLASDNSSKIRDMINLPEFQELWPMQIKADKDAKAKWFNTQGGGMMAVASAGQITGFRAGRMQSGFTGAFIIDDPLKPDDAYSTVKRSGINNRFMNTMRSRLAVETVPMIAIMQRLHEDDMCGFLLKGGSGEKWHHLIIPAMLDVDTMSKQYPEEYTHGIQMNINDILEEMRNSAA